MAELPHVDRKSHLTAELARAREGIAGSWGGLKEDANVSRNFRESFQRHQPIWLGAAAIGGWVLARIPRRGKQVKVYADPKARGVKTVRNTGLLLGLAKIAMPLLKPTIMAFITQKLTQRAAEKGKYSKARP